MAANQCNQCQTEYDSSDAFCRKCGNVIAQEAQYIELAEIQETPVAPVEVKQLTITTPSEITTPVPARSTLKALTNTVGSKMSRALQSPSGKRLVRGATALAVAIGVELINNRSNKSALPNSSKKTLSPSLSTADSLLRAMEEELNQPQNGATVEEVYVRERIYVRRTIRRQS